MLHVLTPAAFQTVWVGRTWKQSQTSVRALMWSLMSWIHFPGFNDAVLAGFAGSDASTEQPTADVLNGESIRPNFSAFAIAGDDNVQVGGLRLVGGEWFQVDGFRGAAPVSDRSARVIQVLSRCSRPTDPIMV